VAASPLIVCVAIVHMRLHAASMFVLREQFGQPDKRQYSTSWQFTREGVGHWAGVTVTTGPA